jgi:hypothetical protein
MASKDQSGGTKLPRSTEVEAEDFKDVHSAGETPSDDGSGELVEGDCGSDNNHVFAEPKVAEYWKGVYEKAEYEGRHRFDPSLTWSASEEIKLKRKVSGKW